LAFKMYFVSGSNRVDNNEYKTSSFIKFVHQVIQITIESTESFPNESSMSNESLL